MGILNCQKLIRIEPSAWWLKQKPFGCSTSGGLPAANVAWASEEWWIVLKQSVDHPMLRQWFLSTIRWHLKQSTYFHVNHMEWQNDRPPDLGVNETEWANSSAAGIVALHPNRICGSQKVNGDNTICHNPLNTQSAWTVDLLSEAAKLNP